MFCREMLFNSKIKHVKAAIIATAHTTSTTTYIAVNETATNAHSKHKIVSVENIK